MHLKIPFVAYQFIKEVANMSKPIIVLLIVLLVMPILPASAEEDIFYTSSPDALSVFLNDIAYARDEINLPGDSDVQIVLPATVYQDTLLVYENDRRVPSYRLSTRDNQIVLRWTTSGDANLHVVRLEYLMRGISWKPDYDMWVVDDENVEFDFFAELRNATLSLEDVPVQLIAGRVDTSQMVNTVTTVTLNQYFAGYDDFRNTSEFPEAQVPEPPQLAGAASIQHIYDAGTITTEPGEFVYMAVLQGTLAARKVLLWNAHSDNEVTVIYKIRNETEQPFAEGIVRSYQNGLFLGSDFVEHTPIGSEGSVTVGGLQTVRVNRETTRTYEENDSNRDYYNEVELTISNFDDETIEMDVVDTYPDGADRFEFETETQREIGNRLRWTITIEPGETVVLRYEYWS
jgi:hypothetical protein